MLTGIRPGAKDHGFGQVTSRIVDLLHRTKTWTRAIAIISFLGVAAFFVLGAVAWFQSKGASPALLVLGLAGILALAVLVLALPLYRFAQAVEQMTPWNRGPSVASAFEHLGSFWRRAGFILAAFLLVVVSGWLLVLWLAQSNPMLAAFVTAARDPQGFAQKEEERKQALIRAERDTSQSRSPLVLKPAQFGKEAPLWVPVPNPPAAPGRRFTFDEIGEACQVADTTFLCLINRPGEPVGGGSRRMITGDDAIITVLPQTEGLRPLLELNLMGFDDRPWRLRLGPQMGYPLMKMTYEGTTDYDRETSKPFLEFFAGPLLCREPQGKFHVRDLAWGTDGLPDRLVVDFQVECDVGPPAIGRLSIAHE